MVIGKSDRHANMKHGHVRQLLFYAPEPWFSFYKDVVSGGARVAGVEMVDPNQIESPEQIAFALVLAPPPGYLSQFPNLEVVMPVGAGVEYILSDPELPDHVSIVRFVQRDMVMRMSEYVVQHALNHHRQHKKLAQMQVRHEWGLLDQPAASERTIGIMGLGTLGQDAAEKLRQIGFNVRGWSKRLKHLEGVMCMSGPDKLEAFLAETEILICLLPLTVETRNLLNAHTLRMLPRNASIINAARGAIINENDLLECLDEGYLREATLDAFTVEPLPREHRFWEHPAITITPHCASAVTPIALKNRLRDVLERICANQSPGHVVDRKLGY